jgi:hypothetical protein
MTDFWTNPFVHWLAGGGLLYLAGWLHGWRSARRVTGYMLGGRL